MSERVINDHLKFQGGSADTGISKMADIIQILAAHDYGGIHYHCLVFSVVCTRPTIILQHFQNKVPSALHWGQWRGCKCWGMVVLQSMPWRLLALSPLSESQGFPAKHSVQQHWLHWTPVVPWRILILIQPYIAKLVSYLIRFHPKLTITARFLNFYQLKCTNMIKIDIGLHPRPTYAMLCFVLKGQQALCLSTNRQKLTSSDNR